MQTNGVTQYPVSISMAFYAPPTNLTIRQNDSVGAIERGLKAFPLDQFSVMEAVKSERALMQTTFKKSQDQLIRRMIAFVKDNEVLRQQLVTAQSYEREVGRVHAQQIAAKETQIASLQSQMATLIADKEKEVQRLQDMLKATEQQKTVDLATAQATWEQQKLQLNQQNSSLQLQVKSISEESDSLKTQAKGESQRQDQAMYARVIAARDKLHADLDNDIQYLKRCKENPSLKNEYDALRALNYTKSKVDFLVMNDFRKLSRL